MTPTLKRWIRGCSLVCGSAAFLVVTFDSGLGESLCVTPFAFILGGLCGAVIGPLVERARQYKLGRQVFSMPKWLAFTCAAVSIVILGVMCYLRPWDPIGPFGYYRIDLGMTEPEIAAVLGDPAKEYRRSRHIGGITSPGVVTVLDSETGLPFEDLPQRYGERARNGENVTMKQWWGSRYTIDVAFDEDGLAVGIYLMTFRKVNWY